MWELILVIGVALLVLLIFTRTNIGRSISSGIAHALTPSVIVESARKATLGIPTEPSRVSITDDAGGVRRELPIEVPAVIYEEPPPKIKTYIDPNVHTIYPTLNPELAGKAIDELPFITTLPPGVKEEDIPKEVWGILYKKLAG